MKKIYTLSIAVATVLYVGCGSAEIHTDGKSMSSLDINQYSTKTGFNNDINTNLVGSFTTEGTAVDIALSNDGNIAYIASGDGGLEVLDISNPRHPVYIKSYDLAEFINHVEVKDDTVYASYITENTNIYKNISTFDISNPSNPIYMGTAEQRSSIAHYRVVKGDYIVEVDDYGLVIYFTDGSQRTIKVSSYQLGDHAYALAVKNNYIFIANGRDGLTVLRSDIAENRGVFIN
jgi:hypothetical protein